MSVAGLALALFVPTGIADTYPHLLTSASDGAAADRSSRRAAGSCDAIINEFQADPAGDITGDANGDGIRDSSEDEFVEIYNDTGSELDMSGWEIHDAIALRHVFPEGSIIANQCAVVVFGGGTPTGAFGGATVQTASTGFLALNNGGDTITLKDAGAVTVAAVTYPPPPGGDNQSITRDPDITGAFALHSTATGSGGALFSPGTMVDATQFWGCGISDPACGPGSAHVVLPGGGQRD